MVAKGRRLLTAELEGLRTACLKTGQFVREAGWNLQWNFCFRRTAFGLLVAAIRDFRDGVSGSRLAARQESKLFLRAFDFDGTVGHWRIVWPEGGAIMRPKPISIAVSLGKTTSWPRERKCE
jgi:hypothetical protein